MDNLCLNIFWIDALGHGNLICMLNCFWLEMIDLLLRQMFHVDWIMNQRHLILRSIVLNWMVTLLVGRSIWLLLVRIPRLVELIDHIRFLMMMLYLNLWLRRLFLFFRLEFSQLLCIQHWLWEYFVLLNKLYPIITILQLTYYSCENVHWSMSVPFAFFSAIKCEKSCGSYPFNSISSLTNFYFWSLYLCN